LRLQHDPSVADAVDTIAHAASHAPSCCSTQVANCQRHPTHCINSPLTQIVSVPHVLGISCESQTSCITCITTSYTDMITESQCNDISRYWRFVTQEYHWANAVPNEAGLVTYPVSHEGSF
jgi:hypothetical protein